MSDTQQQDLSQLEMAFAADPKAFVPLTNAYLQLGRFMEAMVVCKKGIKALPDSVEGRLLLGRVYAEQGKIPKALEEVKGLLATNPEHAEAHFFAGHLHEKSGRFEEAIEAFKETIRRERSHEGAKAALKAKGIDFDPGPSAEEIAAQRAAEEAARAAEEGRLAAEAAAQKAVEEAAAAEATRARQAAQAAKARATGQSIDHFGVPGAPAMGAAAARVAAPVVAATVDPAFAAAYAQNLYGYAGPQAQMAANKRFGPGFTFGFAALLLLIIVGVVFGARSHKQSQDQVKELLLEQQALVKKDTTRGHKKALEKLAAAIKIDDDQELALSQYAYSLAVLADRGVKEADDKTVGDAVAAAKKKAKDHALSIAAQMITLRRAGDAAGAEALGRTVGPDVKLLPVPVRVELGRALLAQGKITDTMPIADSLAENPDVAGFTFAGTVYRAVGDTFKARRAFDNAIKVELDHDPARAIRALFIIEQDDVVNFPVALDDIRSVLDFGKDALGVRQFGYATLGRALLAKRLRAGSDREVDSDLAAARGLLRNDPEMPFFEARIAKDDKRYDDAQKFLDEAIKLDPYRIGPYLALIEVGSRAKKFDVADKAFGDAKQVFGDNLELGLARSTRLLAEQKADDALAHLQNMLKTLDLAEVHRDIGKVYMLKRDYPAAVANLKKSAEKAAVRGPGTQANVYTWLGRALAQAEDHAQAKEAYAQALAVTSEFASTYYWLALSLQALTETAAANDAFNKYLKAEPNGPYAEDARRRLEGGG
jgi:tetratricopeptide (TPR) repeat protein